MNYLHLFIDCNGIILEKMERFKYKELPALQSLKELINRFQNVFCTVFTTRSYYNFTQSNARQLLFYFNKTERKNSNKINWLCGTSCYKLSALLFRKIGSNWERILNLSGSFENGLKLVEGAVKDTCFSNKNFNILERFELIRLSKKNEWEKRMIKKNTLSELIELSRTLFVKNIDNLPKHGNKKTELFLEKQIIESSKEDVVRILVEHSKYKMSDLSQGIHLEKGEIDKFFIFLKHFLNQNKHFSREKIQKEYTQFKLNS